MDFRVKRNEHYKELIIQEGGGTLEKGGIMNKDQQQALIAAYERIADGYMETSEGFRNAAEALRGVTEITDEDYGWIPWNGGEMPVPEGTLVDVKYRDGDILPKRKAGMGVYPNHGAGHQYWKHEADPSDIIAYRIAEPRKDEPHKDYGDEPVAAVCLSEVNDDGVTVGTKYKISGCDIKKYAAFYDDDGKKRLKGFLDPDWQLLYPGKVYAQAPLELSHNSNISPGACYEVVEEDKTYKFYFLKNGEKLCGLWSGGCAHLHGKEWTRIIPEDL